MTGERAPYLQVQVLNTDTLENMELKVALGGRGEYEIMDE